MKQRLLAVLGSIAVLSCSPDYKEIHSDAIVCDLHCDTLMRVLRGGYSLRDRHDNGHVDLPRLKEGGVDLQFFACWADPKYLPQNADDPDSSAQHIRDMINALQAELEANADLMGLALTAGQARDLVGQGKIAAALGVEGGHAIENSLEILQEFYDKGVRYMTLTWNNSNDWADAAAELARGGETLGGLTEFGREVVKTMNRIGMMVDISHVAESTFWDVMETTEDPVIASHSSAYALCPHFRNLKDDQLRAIAANGGVVCVNFYAGYIDSTYARVAEELPERFKAELDSLQSEYGDRPDLLRKARRKIYRRALAQVRVPAERLVDHIDYIAQVAGIDHVGLGSDFDGISRTPDGIDDVADMPEITRILLERGYTPQEIRKILGGYFLRVFGQVCDS